MNEQLNQNHQYHEITLIAREAGLTFIGTIIGIALKYFFELIIARHLGAELFGIFFLGFTIFKILEGMITLGLNNGVLRYVSLYRGIGDKEKIKGTILFSLKIVASASLICFLILTIFSGSLSSSIFHEFRLLPVLIIFAAGLIFSGQTEILVFATQAFQKLKYKVIVRMLVEPGLRVILVIIVFLLGFRLLGASLIFLFSLFIGMILAFHFLKKIFPPFLDKSISSLQEPKKLLRFSWPLFLVGFLNLFIIQVSALILGYYRPSAEVAIYAAAQRTAFLMIVILDSFNAIFAPMLADFYHRKEHQKIEHLFKIVTKWIFSLSFPLFLLMVFFSRELLQLWGEEYTVGILPLVIIAFAQLVNAGVGAVGYLIMMSGRSIINLINNLFVFTLIVILNIFLVPKYGVLGAAISMAVTITLVNLIKLIEVYIIFRIHPYRLDYLKPIVSGMIAVTLLIIFCPCLKKFLPGLLFPISGSLLFLIVYIGLISAFKISKEERFLLLKLKYKILARNFRSGS